MRAAPGLLVASALLGCVTSYDELPLCHPVTKRERAAIACRESDEAQAYREWLATQVLRRSQWEYPYGVPLGVTLDAAGRVGRVCVGSERTLPDWSTRDRVAASLSVLRAAPVAPECLAGSQVELSGTMAELGAPTGSEPPPLGLSWCEGKADPKRRCPSEWREVCAVFRDGRRQGFENACQACKQRNVIGYYDFHCK